MGVPHMGLMGNTHHFGNYVHFMARIQWPKITCNGIPISRSSELEVGHHITEVSVGVHFARDVNTELSGRIFFQCYRSIDGVLRALHLRRHLSQWALSRQNGNSFAHFWSTFAKVLRTFKISCKTRVDRRRVSFQIWFAFR